jgi:DNA-binding protein HU-beta
MYVKAKKILASELMYAKNMSEDEALAWLEETLTEGAKPKAPKPVAAAKKTTTTAAAKKPATAAKKTTAAAAKKTATAKKTAAAR